MNGLIEDSTGNIEFDFAFHGGVPLITFVL